MNTLLRYIIFLVIGSSGLTACNNNSGKPPVTDTGTSGDIKIVVDESFEPILDSHVYTFEKTYKYATIRASYKPEGEAIRDLLNDSVRLAIVPRELTDEENKVFKNIKITPRVTKIAIDGVALIVHPNNPDTLLAIPQLQDIFTGKVKSWKQINSKSSLSDITIVFDNNNSSTARYILDSINHKQPLAPNAFAAKSHKALIDYVANNPNAIGVLGVSWISDFDDPNAMGFLDKINVVSVGLKVNPSKPDTYYQPFQAYLAQGTYPLRRNLYIISREARVGLGTGFAAFVARDKGQRIFLKSGLVPANAVLRLVTVTE
ncbi:PstS family phosphate ABC transporter substrate-binding protein [Adhaeribacter aquaticus]|uniref:PstS family phosphate ABC transporter substrate-binding protein n=1 Tax=Adhaeribacter aquaticus TaxID=299567 RepID=UPI0003FD46EF|nr:substrate-binding domain-containing protein [Adhaeribacter aquaticus]